MKTTLLALCVLLAPTALAADEPALTREQQRRAFFDQVPSWGEPARVRAQYQAEVEAAERNQYAPIDSSYSRDLEAKRERRYLDDKGPASSVYYGSNGYESRTYHNNGHIETIRLKNGRITGSSNYYYGR